MGGGLDVYEEGYGIARHGVAPVFFSYGERMARIFCSARGISLDVFRGWDIPPKRVDKSSVMLASLSWMRV